MHAQTLFAPSTPLATATVQDMHLELIRRSEPNAFQGTRVLADLLAHRHDWPAVLFDTYGLATDHGLPARLLKLRDMAANDYNADTLYILAVDAAAPRLAALAEAWGAKPHIYSQEDTERALGTSCASERLVQIWWDESAEPPVLVAMIVREACPGGGAVHRGPRARVQPQPCWVS